VANALFSPPSTRFLFPCQVFAVGGGAPELGIEKGAEKVDTKKKACHNEISLIKLEIIKC